MKQENKKINKEEMDEEAKDKCEKTQFNTQNAALIFFLAHSQAFSSNTFLITSFFCGGEE